MPLSPEQENNWQSIVAGAELDFSRSQTAEPIEVPSSLLDANYMTHPIDFHEAVDSAVRDGTMTAEEGSIAIDFFFSLLGSSNATERLQTLPRTEREGVAYLKLVFPASDEPYAP